MWKKFLEMINSDEVSPFYQYNKSYIYITLIMISW